MLGMLAGAVIALALTGLIAVLRGWQPTLTTVSSARQVGRMRRAVEELPEGWRRNYRLLLVAAAVTGVLVWALSGWPVHGLLAAVAVAALPFVLYPGGPEQAEAARLTAIAEWLHQLASVRASGKPLQEILKTLDTVPDGLRRETSALAARLSSGMPARWAYRMLGDDLDSRIGDDIVRLFRDHTLSSGPGLAAALSAQAILVDRQVSDLHDIEAERRKARAEARRVSLFALAVVAVILGNGSYSAPFATPLGQLGLIGLGVAYVASLIWLRRMAQLEPEPRTLPTAKERSAEEQTAQDLRKVAG
jgi:hypothetical protein